jgi:hypothetical protein
LKNSSPVNREIDSNDFLNWVKALDTMSMGGLGV